MLTLGATYLIFNNVSWKALRTHKAQSPPTLTRCDFTFPISNLSERKWSTVQSGIIKVSSLQ